jgi:hypothetical protein
MNIFNIQRAFKQKQERGWDTIYWMIDIHETIFQGKYCSDQDFTVSDECIEVLKWISDRPDCKIIIWTSSYAKHYEDVKQHFTDKYNITLDYHNENPECGNTDYADFTTKPYFNILLDDKAGMEMNSDWSLVKSELQRIGEW